MIMSVFARPARPRLPPLVSSRSHQVILVPRNRTVGCRPLSTTVNAQAPRNLSSGNGFTSIYDPTDTGRGPMFSKPAFGVPQFYPRDLKKQVDEYVVGQDRAKKTICSVIFNHYQSLRRRMHDELNEHKAREKLQRQQRARDRDIQDRQRDIHPVEDEFPGHHESIQQSHKSINDAADNFYLPEDPNLPQPVKIDKSNLLLIGPTGVGKTYILETLSKKLNVPFTICDCNSFTQAGYIGQDVENCIERLLIETNYDIKATERGIVVLDEFDKIARRETVNSRDVGGEGVQQALLKIVEGTKVTINVKDNRSTRSAAPITSNYGSGSPTAAPPILPPSGRSEQFTIDTKNILFVFCGAFVGLDKHVLQRVAKPSIGFGAEIGSGRSSSKSGTKAVLPKELYMHLPHQPLLKDGSESGGFTPLDLTTPDDLQAFGFIPELIGRLHNICALTPLSQDELYRILTEPRNSLVTQYTALFETYPSQLYFTRKSLYAIAEQAARNKTGARGLKMEMERVLAEPMFEAPVDHVLITEGCVRGTEKAGYWLKDGRIELERRMRDEDQSLELNTTVSSFEQYREAGQGGA